ncbi:hypothetical protein MMC30_000723 [Trapelia coarctata]|nr:hypothetical protein [Trapelia coarctata]
MKSFTISAALTLIAAALVHAAPVEVEARQFAAQITFQGATPEAQFTQSFPGDGTVVQITNPLSISHISSLGGATCAFYGIDGSHTILVGAQTVDVGPPQTQISGVCRSF